MQKVRYWRVFLLCLLVFLSGYLIYHREAVQYGLRQGKGQLTMLMSTHSIDEVVQADTLTPEQLRKLRLIEQIKKFTVDSLGLNPSNSYTSYYNQQGKPLMWMIVASEKFSISPYTWQFPILGKFTYKGHFSKEIALQEIEKLKAEGYDTRLSAVAAWSTLGYLNDPILSSMLDKSDGQLAALIIHELTHGTLYVKNNVTFNENLADFVGDYGATRFLINTYGKNSDELKQFEAEKTYEQAFTKHFLQGAKQLDSLYQSADFRKLPLAQRLQLKENYLDDIVVKADTLTRPNYLGNGRTKWRPSDLNNAYFISFINYQSKQNQFEEEFKQRFGGNFSAYMSYLKKQYPSL